MLNLWDQSILHANITKHGQVSRAKTAGKDIELKYLGVYVLTVTDNSTFKGILNISDTVTAVNDQTFDSSKDLIDYVNSQN